MHVSPMPQTESSHNNQLITALATYISESSSRADVLESSLLLAQRFSLYHRMFPRGWNLAVTIIATTSIKPLLRFLFKQIVAISCNAIYLFGLLFSEPLLVSIVQLLEQWKIEPIQTNNYKIAIPDVSRLYPWTVVLESRTYSVSGLRTTL